MLYANTWPITISSKNKIQFAPELSQGKTYLIKDTNLIYEVYEIIYVKILG